MICSIKEHNPARKESSVGKKGPIEEKDICEVAVATGEEAERCPSKDRAGGKGFIGVCWIVSREKEISNYAWREKIEKI